MSNPSTKVIKLTNTQKPFLERNDNLNRYYADIRNYGLLSDEETKKLFFQMINSNSDEEKNRIKDTIFEHNALLVISLARKFCSQNDNLNDLIEEGNMGLLIAINKYNPNKGTTFASFALFYIRREINMFRSNYTGMVQKTNRSKTDNLAKKITSQFIQKEGRVPTPQELLSLYNKACTNDVKRINDHRDLINVEYVYVDALDANDGEFTDCQSYLDYSHATSSRNEYYDQMDNDYNVEKLDNLMKGLKPKEKLALRLMYGLETGFEESLSSIGLRLGCSSERARQLCEEGIKKMQKKCNSYAK